MRRLLFLILVTGLFGIASAQAAIVKKFIDGVYYNFDTSSRVVTFVTGQGSGTNRTEFKGTTLHVPATMEMDGITYTMGNIGNAFQGCQNLETLTFDSPVKFTEISLWAFAECPKLKSVIVPEGVTTLGADRAFGSCQNLEEITLPTTIKTIGGWSFFDDPALKVVHINTPTPPALGTYAFGGSTNCVITIPDEAYDTYKSNNAWKSFTLMKASEYSIGSGKIALINYLTANATAMDAAKGGNTPDVYPLTEYERFIKARNDAEKICKEEHEQEVYDVALDALQKAWEAMLQSYNPISSGYYNIQSAYTNFYSSQGEHKALTGAKDNVLAWNSFKDLDPYQAFYIEALDNGNLRISNYATNKYINGAASNDNGVSVMMGEKSECEQIIKPIGELQWTICDDKNTKAYHPQNHSNGAGKEGNIVLFDANTINGQSAWRLLPIHDNVIEALHEVLNAKQNTQKLVDLQKKAQQLCDSVLRYTMSTQRLLTSATQISSNAQSAAEGTIAALIDGNVTGSPYFHSTYGNPADPGVPHYLQMTLKSPIKAFKAVLARRNGAYGYADSPRDILISASNDGKNFTDITHYTTTWDADIVESKTTDLILLGDSYKYIRYTVLRTSQNRCNSGQSHPYFTLSELQMYEALLDEENSTYFDSEDIQQAYKELQNILKSQQEIVDAGLATQEDIDNLQAAMDNLRNPKAKTDDILPALDSKTKLADGSWCAIGNIVGKVDAETGKDYTDYVSERVHFSQVLRRPLKDGKANSAYFQIKQADYYTIEIGVADAAAGTPAGDLNDYIKCTNSGSIAYWYKKIIDQVIAINPEAKIVLCTPRHNGETDDTLANYAALIRQIGEYEGYPVADLFAEGGGTNKADEASENDDYNLDDDDHQRIANIVVAAIDKVLRYDSLK